MRKKDSSPPRSQNDTRFSRRYLRTTANGAFFDSSLVLRALKDGVDVNAGRVHLVRRDTAEFHQFFHLRNHVIGCRSHHWIIVSGRLAIHQIAPAIALPGFDESEI